MKKSWVLVSLVLFIIGLVISIIGGLVMPANPIVAMILAIFGLIIGIIYVFHGKDINTLLLATIALLAMSSAFAPITPLDTGKMITSMLLYFAALMAPVALITAVKALIRIGMEK